MNTNRNITDQLYELAVAKDAANLIDIDAALAMSRAAVRTLMALSPQSSHLVRAFVQQESERLQMDETVESNGAIAIINNTMTL